MVHMAEVSIGDMVRHDGGWFVVKRLSPITDDVQLSMSDGRTSWVPVTEISAIEKRAS